MKADALFEELKKDRLRPVYFLYGEDDFLKDESYARLKEAVLKGGMADFNFDLFHGGDIEISKVLSAASTLPMMLAKRLVVLKGADRLKADEQEALLGYIEDPSPTTVFVMVGTDIDKRRKMFSLIDKGGGLVEHRHPFEREMPKWIRRVAGKRGLEVSDEAAKYLVDIIGTDLNSVSSELEKAALYAGERKRIEIGDIEAVTVDVKSRTVFQLIDAIGTKNLKESLENLKKLLDGGENPIPVLNMIARQLRLIWAGVEILKGGGREADVKKGVRMPPFAFKEYFKQLKIFKEAELKEAFSQLAELDIKFKSSRIDKEKALELLIFRLCR